MKRRCHYLKANKGSETVHDAIWVDTETKGVPINDTEQRHELFTGMAAYRRTTRKDEWTKPLWAQYVTFPEFWDWVEARLHGKSRLYLFAHNWAFDAPVLDMFNELPKRGWKLISAVIQSPPIILRWRKGPHTIQVVDTLNIWRMPLSKVGSSIGLPKLEMPSYEASVQEWTEYNKRDVQIIMEACIKWWIFLKSNDLGGFASTLAAQAMRSYRHKFMSTQILIDDNTDALTLAREALHGGRCECHFIGTCKETVYKLDINSQYPAIMASEYLPARIIGSYSRVTITELQEWVDKYCVTAKVLIDTDEPVYAVFHNKKLVFPIGQFWTTLSTPEIQYALQHNHIKQVDSAAVYEREILFKDYVTYFHAHRQTSRVANNEADSDNAKLMMNALFGKWAQKGIYYEKIAETQDRTIELWTDHDVETGKTYHMRQYAGIIEQQGEYTEARESHPAIAAHITAHGRMQLWGLMQIVGVGNYYYNDTDSLWVNEKGAVALSAHMHDNELGKLKTEGVHSQVIIHGPKDYYIDGLTKIKGIKKNAVQIQYGEFEQDKFTTLVGLLRRGDLTAPIVSKVTKHLRRIYDKGVVDKNGRVLPLTLTLDD